MSILQISMDTEGKETKGMSKLQEKITWGQKKMNGSINIENFKQIMQLRESFASNRKKDKIEVITFSFGTSEKLAIVKQGQRIELLGEVDKYKQKDFTRKLSLVKARK